jgi:hypothetical protein
MSVNHSDLPFSLKSFDLDRVDSGVITYRIGEGAPEDDFEIEDLEASSSFPIVEASKKN